MIGIGYDIGSSFVKAALVEVQTKSYCTSELQVEISMESQQPGWAEQAPNLWWNIFAKPLKNF